MDFHGIHLPDKNEPTTPGKKLSEESFSDCQKSPDSHRVRGKIIQKANLE